MENNIFSIMKESMKKDFLHIGRMLKDNDTIVPTLYADNLVPRDKYRNIFFLKDNSKKIKFEDIIKIEGFPQSFLDKDERNAKIRNYKLSWRVTRWCNFRCPFCYQKEVHDPRLEKDMLERYAQGINNLAHQIIERDAKEGYKSLFNIHIIGGEVGFLDLKKISSIIFSGLDTYVRDTIMVTNLSAPKENYMGFVEESLKVTNKVTIQASFHPEQTTLHEGWSETFFENAKAILEMNTPGKFVSVLIKCVVSNDNVSLYKKYESNLDEFVNVDWAVARNYLENKNDTSKEVTDFVDKKNNTSRKNNTYLTIVLRDGTRVGFSSSTRFIQSVDKPVILKDDWMCTMGLTNIRINNGIVRQGACAGTGFAHLKPWGDLNKSITEFEFPKSAIVCKNPKVCSCCFKTTMWRKEREVKDENGKIFVKDDNGKFI